MGQLEVTTLKPVKIMMRSIHCSTCHAELEINHSGSVQFPSIPNPLMPLSPDLIEISANVAPCSKCACKI